MARLRTTATSLVANGVGAALGQLIEVMALVALARSLSAMDVATYFLVLQGIRFAYILESGMGQDLTRSLAGTFRVTQDSAQRAMKAGILWYAWLCAGSMVLVLGASVIVVATDSEVRLPLLLLIGGAGALRILSDGCSRALMGLMMLVHARSTTLVRSVGLLTVTLGLAPMGSVAFGLGVLALEVVVLAASIIPLWRRLGASWSHNGYSAKEYRQIVSPMAKANVTGFLSNRLDGFLVGFFAGPSAVVIHGILLRLYDVARGGIELLMTGVVQATSVSSRAKNRHDLSVVLEFALGVSTTVSAVVAVGIFAGRSFLDSLLPDQLNVSWWTYMVVAVALVMVSQSVAYVYVATGLNYIDRLLLGVYLSSAVNFVTTLLATRAFGVVGPFLGVAAGGLVSAFACPWSLRHEISEWPRNAHIRRIRGAALLILLAGIAASLLDDSKILQVGVAGIVVVVGAVITRSLPLRRFLSIAHLAR